MKHQLRSSIGLFPTTALVVGAMVGSGIFVSPAAMARNSSSGLFLLGIWAIAGVFTLIGALTQCELCSSMPRSGGLYTYLKEAFGDKVAFFYGWANFMIAGSGGLAAVSFIFASYLNEFIPLWHPPATLQSWSVRIPYLGTLFPMADIGEKLVGCAVVLGLTWINTKGIRAGAGLQSVSTTLKIFALVFIVVSGFCDPMGSSDHIASVKPAVVSLDLWQILGFSVLALSGAFWSYDGWGNVAYVAGEVERPARTVPQALILGTGIVIVIYILVNAAFLYSFGVEGLGQVPGDRVASALMGRVFGPAGLSIVVAMILLSTFDGTNAGVLTNARVYHTMALEGLLPAAVGRCDETNASPYVALWLQCAWTIILIVTGSFDLITRMYVWVNWLFYLLMASAVFVCRRRGMPRSFTIWGYPYVPAAFFVFTCIYLIMTLVQDVQNFQAGRAPTINSLMGLLLVLAGFPLYWMMKRYRKTGMAV